ncbi:DUF3795 domain-containing protein [Candidatus Bipolaricaulota bacterium]|nr:DUF3795 domain-containing protein [Candidatus Bipolaricaulota bacterium]
MSDHRFVTYCGLYCGLCSARSRIPAQATALRETIVKEGYDDWGQELPNFREFRAFLDHLCDPDRSCPGCRAEGGPPFCGIRKCARKRGVEICPQCPDYPCHRIAALAEGYPTLIPDGRRMQRIGVPAWIAEQEERASTGFCYADIRCRPYEIPTD